MGYGCYCCSNRLDVIQVTSGSRHALHASVVRSVNSLERRELYSFRIKHPMVDLYFVRHQVWLGKVVPILSTSTSNCDRLLFSFFAISSFEDLLYPTLRFSVNDSWNTSFCLRLVHSCLQLTSNINCLFTLSGKKTF